MTCGKLHVQACNAVWILSTVYLVSTAQPILHDVKSTTQAVYNLVIQRPRIAGGTLTIPLDTTVQVVNNFVKDTKHHTVRLRYGLNGKNLVMRASSSQEYEQWLFAITVALSESQQCVKNLPSTESSLRTSSSKKPQSTRSKKPSRTRISFPSVSNSVTSIKMQHDVSSASGPPLIMTNCGSPTTSSTTDFPEVRRTTHSVPANCSLRRMLRQNIPSGMQFLITVGQIIASAS